MFGLRSEQSDFPVKSCTNWGVSAHFWPCPLDGEGAVCRAQADLSHTTALYVKNTVKTRLIGGFSHNSRDAPM